MPTFKDIRVTEPSTPTPELLRCFPEFSLYGKANCGEHNPFYGASAGSCDVPLHPMRRRCVCCSRLIRAENLHPLPCNHDLCRDCLDRTVEQMNQRTSSRSLWDTIVEPLLATRNALLIRAGIAIDQGLPSLSTRHATEAEIALLQAQNALDMTCCGMDMHLETYLECMTPECARQWISARWGVGLPPVARMRCGWPDCHGWIPDWCFFSRKDEYRLPKWHCVLCGGNSMMSALSQPNLFPAA